MEILFMIILCILLLISSVSDIKNRIIPNVIVAIILILGILYSLLYHSLYTALSGILIPSVPLFVAKYRLNFSIGAGDIKLLAAIGAWVGWFMNVYVYLIGSVIALLYVLMKRLFFHDRLSSVPFAPYLSIATLSVYFFDKITYFN